MKKSRRRFAPLHACLMIAAAMPALAIPPVTISPGGGEGIQAVFDQCSTSSWSAVDNADSYELVVYEMDSSGAESERLVIHERIPGGGVVWTPDAASCLTTGRVYAWAVRTRVDGEDQIWSELAMFRVIEPRAAELERGIRRIRERMAEDEVAAARAPIAPEAGGDVVSGSGSQGLEVAGNETAGTGDFMVDTNGKVFDITAFHYRRVCTANRGGSSATASPCSDLIGSGQGVMTGGGCDCGGWECIVCLESE